MSSINPITQSILNESGQRQRFHHAFHNTKNQLNRLLPVTTNKDDALLLPVILLGSLNDNNDIDFLIVVFAMSCIGARVTFNSGNADYMIESPPTLLTVGDVSI